MSSDPTSFDPSRGDGSVSEEDIRRLVAAYQQYQNQADAIVRQISLTQLTADELGKAATAVEAMDKTARQKEVAEGSKKLSEMLSRIDQEMQKIQAIMAQYEQQAQGSGQKVV